MKAPERLGLIVGDPFTIQKDVMPLQKTLKKKTKSSIPVRELLSHVNDESLGREVVREFKKLTKKNQEPYKKSERRERCCPRERSLT